VRDEYSTPPIIVYSLALFVGYILGVLTMIIKPEILDQILKFTSVLAAASVIPFIIVITIDFGIFLYKFIDRKFFKEKGEGG